MSQRAWLRVSGMMRTRATWIAFTLSVSLGCPSTPEVSRDALLPAVRAYLELHPGYGERIERIEPLPNWARGERQAVTTESARHVFYVHEGRVVTVLRNRPDGSMEDLLRIPVPDEPERTYSKPASDKLPAYRVIGTVQHMDGTATGDVLITSMSRKTPVAVRRDVLQQIMTKDGYKNAYLYCSEAAFKANNSEDFRTANPNAMKRCFLGSWNDGRFYEGEQLYP